MTLYLSMSGNKKLKPKLERELRPKSRIVSLGIQIKGWTPLKIAEAPGKHITYLYKLAGTLVQRWEYAPECRI